MRLPDRPSWAALVILAGVTGLLGHIVGGLPPRLVPDDRGLPHVTVTPVPEPKVRTVLTATDAFGVWQPHGAEPITIVSEHPVVVFPDLRTSFRIFQRDAPRHAAPQRGDDRLETEWRQHLHRAGLVPRTEAVRP